MLWSSDRPRPFYRRPRRSSCSTNHLAVRSMTSREKVLRTWAREWFKDGRKTDLKKLPERPAFENLPRRWVAERTFAWISYNRRMSKDHERLCSTGEAFVHATMARLMVRRLARA